MKSAVSYSSDESDRANRMRLESQFYRRIESQADHEVVSTVLGTDALCHLHCKFKETFLKELSNENEKECARSVYFTSAAGNQELSGGELSNNSDDKCSGLGEELEMKSFASQESISDHLEPLENNLNALHFYAIEISPGVNFQFIQPTSICHGAAEYVFQGFCLVSSVPLSDVPCCKLVRFNTCYTISLKQMPRKAVEMFCMVDLDILRNFIFHEMLGLASWEELKRTDSNQLYIFPCFSLEESSTEQIGSLLPLGNVIEYILDSSQYTFRGSDCYILDELLFWPSKTFPALRVDGIQNEDDGCYVIHKSRRKLPATSHQRIDKEMKLYKRYQRKQKAGVALTSKESQHMANLKTVLNERRRHRIKDDQLVCSVRQALRTGLKCDIAQHALIIPALCQHIRHFLSLPFLELKLQYTFADKALLQVSVTHPSFSLQHGSIDTNLAQAAQSNCGPRHVQYGPCRLTQSNKKKPGHCKLSELVTHLEDEDVIGISNSHNQRLEFLGDAVVGYIAMLVLLSVLCGTLQWIDAQLTYAQLTYAIVNTIVSNSSVVYHSVLGVAVECLFMVYFYICHAANTLLSTKVEYVKLGKRVLFIL
jgi:hypothetical protein